MVNSPLIRPYSLEGVALVGGTLDSQEMCEVVEVRSYPYVNLKKTCMK